MSQLTGLVLDIEGGSLENGAPIIQSENDGRDTQRWFVSQRLSGGFVKIMSLASEKVLDVEGGSLEDGAPI
jgi:alpha-L-fucosidase